MLIIGTRFFTWGAALTAELMRCGQCGTVAQFKEKSGMRFVTLFFIVPIIPISGINKMLECTNCKARYQAA